MKNLEIENLGLVELNTAEVNETEGGFVPMMIAAAIYILMEMNR